MGEENTTKLLFGMQIGDSYVPIMESEDISELSFIDTEMLNDPNTIMSAEETIEFELKDKVFKSLHIKFSDGSEAEYASITRCKDCIHFYYADNRIPEERCWVCEYDGYKRDKNDFCSDAKRKVQE